MHTAIPPPIIRRRRSRRIACLPKKHSIFDKRKSKHEVSDNGLPYDSQTGPLTASVVEIRTYCRDAADNGHVAKKTIWPQADGSPAPAFRAWIDIQNNVGHQDASSGLSREFINRINVNEVMPNV
jgi:hypothetical protein